MAWLMGMTGAFMTAFYMTRLMVMTFWGEYRGGGHDPHGLRAPVDPHHHGHDDHGHHGGHHEPHEVPWNMWVPVAVLAGLALVSGFLNIPHSLHFLGGAHFSDWLAPLLFQKEAVHAAHGAAPAIEYGLMGWATLVWAPGAMLLAWWIYKVDPTWSKAKAFVAAFPGLFRWVHNKYFVDEFYEWAFIGPCKQLGAQLWAFDAWVVDGMVNGAARFALITANISFWFDARIIDGFVNLVAWVLQQTAQGFRKLQSGRVHNYAFLMFLGFLGFALWKFLA